MSETLFITDNLIMHLCIGILGKGVNMVIVEGGRSTLRGVFQNYILRTRLETL